MRSVLGAAEMAATLLLALINMAAATEPAKLGSALQSLWRLPRKSKLSRTSRSSSLPIAQCAYS